MSNKDYSIRQTTLEDMYEISDAHTRSIKEICSKDYSPEQIEAYSDVRYSPGIWEQSITQEYHLSVVLNKRIEGFCHTKLHTNHEGEIAGLYFTSKISGQGIAREVFQMAIDFLKKNNVNRVFISSSKTAKGFYEKMGFETLEQEIINVRGANLECYRMERFLS